jgi:allophanate hydrolase
VPPPRFVFGVPRPADLKFFDNAEAERLYGEAVARLESLGGEAREIDYTPFAEAADFLYGGPWLAERASSLGGFLAERPQEILPVIQEILAGGGRYSAADTFAAQHRLAGIGQQTSAIWREIDCLALPTAGTVYRVDEVERDPIALNANLGYYTNFVNLLDLSAIAVPAGFQKDGLPAGVTLVAPAWHDGFIAGIAAAFHRATGLPLGATQTPQPLLPATEPADFPYVSLAVVGAHLSGEPLNPELTALGARFRRACRTAPRYRLYALPDGKRPGLVREPAGGTAVEIEVWDVPATALGGFVAGIAPPLGIGTLELEDGTATKGFLCESHGIAGALDISGHGGWRAYRRSLR